MGLVVRKIPDMAIDFIKRWEGCILHIYKDAIGLDTVGIGHLIRSGEDFSGGITEDEANDLLRKDLRQSAISVMNLITVELTDGQYSALLSFCFNLGPGALRVSTLRLLLNEGDYLGAADQFLRWVYAGGRKLKGLVLRRQAERELFLYG
jgi:lysozyme